MTTVVVSFFPPEKDCLGSCRTKRFHFRRNGLGISSLPPALQIPE